MTFDQWYSEVYPKLADGHTSFKEALRAAFEAGRQEGPEYPNDPSL